MRARLKSRRFKFVTALVVFLLGASVAFAYFTSTSSGTGSAHVGSGAVTITPGSATAALHPGSSADVALTVSNPAPNAAHIGSLSLDTGQSVNTDEPGYSVDGDHLGCQNPDLTFTTQTNGATGWTVPAQSGAIPGTLDLDLAGAISMGANADNACKGATFTVYLNASS